MMLPLNTLGPPKALRVSKTTTAPAPARENIPNSGAKGIVHLPNVSSAVTLFHAPAVVSLSGSISTLNAGRLPKELQ